MARFVYFGFDIFAPCLERLLNDGHELVHLYSFFTDNKHDFNQRVINLAVARDVPVSFHKPKAQELQTLYGQGCSDFISAGYAYKIPPLPKDAFGINIHPTLLPLGRGKFPLPHVLLNHPEAGGVSVHKLAPEFDTGDILLQKAIEVQKEDDLETLSAKVVRDAPDLISEVMRNKEHYVSNARPQNEKEVSLWQFPSNEMRTIDWASPVSEINRIGRAFSRAGWIAPIQGIDYWVYQYKAWPENHGFTPGDVVSILDREIAVAAQDGFVCLKEFEAKQDS